jgi:hypothetical protein
MLSAPVSALSSLVPRHAWLRFIIDHNPCYLLSAACMLLGCYLLNSALYTPAGDVGKLLAVLVVVNLYEACVIVLARILIRFPLVQRDAWIVLFVESLFLTDITFVSGVISTVDPASGLAINAGLLVLAALKVYVILRLLRVQHLARTFTFILLQIATLLAIPIIFKRLSLPNHGWVSPVAVYLSWWVVGLLPVVGTMLWIMPKRRGVQHQPSLADQILCGLYIVVPFISLLVHLYSAAWVYEVPFTPAFIAPVVLGLAVSFRVAEALMDRYHMSLVQMILLFSALGLSIDFPATLSFRIEVIESIVLSPLRLTLMASAAFGIHAFWRHYRYAFLLTSAACLAAAVLGPTLPAIKLAVIHLGQMTWALAWRSVPRTTLQWGWAAVAGAFALLGLGAVMSRHKLSWPQAEDAPPADAPPTT